MWEMQKAQVGNKLKMKMDKTGKITSISGFEPVYQKINKAATATIKDAAQTKILWIVSNKVLMKNP
jgi:hypothetical protein